MRPLESRGACHTRLEALGPFVAGLTVASAERLELTRGEPVVASFEATDLQNLGTGEAIVRAERADFEFNLRTLPLPAIDEESAVAVQQRIVALSRQKYAASRAIVEAELLKARGEPPAEEPPKSKRAEPVAAQVPTQPDVAAPKADAPPPAVPVIVQQTVGRLSKPVASSDRA